MRRELFLARRMRPCRSQNALHRLDGFCRNILCQIEHRLATADQLEINRRQQFTVDPRAVFFARAQIDGETSAEGIEIGRLAGKALARHGKRIDHPPSQGP